jgi:hypothetical protein
MERNRVPEPGERAEVRQNGKRTGKNGPKGGFFATGSQQDKSCIQKFKKITDDGCKHACCFLF